MVRKEEAGPAGGRERWEEGLQQRAGWWDPSVRGFQSMWVVRKWKLSLRFLLQEFIAKRREGEADDPLRFELEGWGQRRDRGKIQERKGVIAGTVPRGGGQARSGAPGERGP